MNKVETVYSWSKQEHVGAIEIPVLPVDVMAVAKKIKKEKEKISLSKQKTGGANVGRLMLLESELSATVLKHLG